jgi:hypothetical protein
MPLHPDHRPYHRFTTRQRLDKAIHTLEGILVGIGIDRLINDQELVGLTRWVIDHREFADRHPFTELLPRIELAFADKQIDEEERCDLLWLCEKYSPTSEFYGTLTADMQRLHGVLGGIIADKIVTKEELKGLETWLDENTHLKCCWPYDEVESLIVSTLADHKIDADEHNHLVHFLTDFAKVHDSLPTGSLAKKASMTAKGICATCPEMEFLDKLFCFTGGSERASRNELVQKIEELGGRFSKNVVQDLDYLVVGADGNPCWAFSCYGRKVEQAVEYRRRGFRLMIIHEYDFWDAIEDR